MCSPARAISHGDACAVPLTVLPLASPWKRPLSTHKDNERQTKSQGLCAISFLTPGPPSPEKCVRNDPGLSPTLLPPHVPWLLHSESCWKPGEAHTQSPSAPTSTKAANLESSQPASHPQALARHQSDGGHPLPLPQR